MIIITTTTSTTTATTYLAQICVLKAHISFLAQTKPTQIYVSTIKCNDTRHLRKP